jgi:Glycosyl hydrolase family 65, N-terminal domain
LLSQTGISGCAGATTKADRVLARAFVNGLHETWPITYAEDAYGLARTGQTIVNVPDPTVIQVYVEDEPFYLPYARTPHYARVLDMRCGTLARQLVWSTPAGKHVRISSRRIVSLEYRHLTAILRSELAPVTICSRLINRRRLPDERAPREAAPRLATPLPAPRARGRARKRSPDARAAWVPDGLQSDAARRRRRARRGQRVAVRHDGLGGRGGR